MINKNINVLNDYFVRYLFASSDSNALLLDFINSTMLDSKVNNFYLYILKIFKFVNFLLFFFPQQKEPYEVRLRRKCKDRISTK